MNDCQHLKLRKMRGFCMPTYEYQAMLMCIKPKCYVEAESTAQGGDVIKVIKNRYGIPVCLKVNASRGGIDYISADRISFWEPWDEYIMVSDLLENIGVEGDEYEEDDEDENYKDDGED